MSADAPAGAGDATAEGAWLVGERQLRPHFRRRPSPALSAGCDSAGSAATRTARSTGRSGRPPCPTLSPAPSAPCSSRACLLAVRRPRAAADDPRLPHWVASLEALPGAHVLEEDYWTTSVNQPHGSDTIIGLLHDSDEDPASHGARVVCHTDQAGRRLTYSIWPLGRRVCGHPGLVHGGVTALLLDEAFGQSYWHFVYPTRGAGFTANLNVDYKRPAPSNACVLILVELTAVEGRKVRFSATVSDGPQMGAVYATASALFVVAAKDAPPQPPAAAVAA